MFINHRGHKVIYTKNTEKMPSLWPLCAFTFVSFVVTIELVQPY